ncbi:2,3-bisphosphoglycerate-dependent phosphoglycerate mutase [Paenibacillus plantiphilus]|uniref:2,3-bisphosphoglycerate-dependent phosphoglycerate mutase n=1 Tax=Paenibacillus plantiphilus TaxID=2905650 RepID=A0ABN8GYH8_9BACL|nr:histidine phosphatase family protein [Paenibacillus plantiphilus]CAH1222228.1 2,3-bisphosphoglycerate-dependent phosphoglycerate mutase [Paenibacillus plantiphilus]
MNKLILIRHGEAEHLLHGMVGGWTDTQLTALGREQARRTGEKLLHQLSNTPVYLLGSDLSRACETAEIIGAILNTKPVIVEDLRELNNGAAATLSKEEAEKLALPMTEPIIDWIPYPNAESWRMMHTRLSNFMDKIALDNNEVVIIVSHSNAIIALIHWWLSFPPEMFNRSFDIQPCSITHLRINEWQEKTIAKLNDTAHLD